MGPKGDKNPLDLAALEKILSATREESRQLPSFELSSRKSSRGSRVPIWVWILGYMVVISGCFLLIQFGLWIWQSREQIPAQPVTASPIVPSPKAPDEVRYYCLDSDGNQKPDDIYIKGEVIFLDKSGNEQTLLDECNGSRTQVNEMWCYENPAGSGQWVAGRMVYDCPLGCFDGECNRP